MARRTVFFLLVAAAMHAAPTAARASIEVIGDLRRRRQHDDDISGCTLRRVRSDRSAVGDGHGDPAANFEPPAFQKLSPWADSGSDTATYAAATGPRVVHGQALVFDLYLQGDINDHLPFAFDFYAFDDDARGANFVDFSAHVYYSGTVFTITMPSTNAPEIQLLSTVPEPAAIVVWSLLGALVFSFGRRRKAA